MYMYNILDSGQIRVFSFPAQRVDCQQDLPRWATIQRERVVVLGLYITDSRQCIPWYEREDRRCAARECIHQFRWIYQGWLSVFLANGRDQLLKDVLQ